jgi:hypothetical protein
VNPIAAGPTFDPDDAALPNWNGPLAAASLRWCARHDAPHFCRLLLTALALIADDCGLVGPVPDREVGHLIGLEYSVVRTHRSWLTRRGAIVETRRPGRAPILWISETVRGCIPSCDLLDCAPVGVAQRDADAGAASTPPILMGEHR